MLKQPRAGQVKTRLGRDIGMTAAAWWFRHQSARTIRQLRDPRWQTRLSIAPGVQARTSRLWPADIPRDAQSSGDLGQRMRHVLARSPAGPVVLIGGDIPGITPALIAGAFSVLGQNEMVFGPATDGGFWLVGWRSGSAPVPAGIFANVRWSSGYTLKDTLAGLSGTRVGFVGTLGDVDTAADLGNCDQGALAPRAGAGYRE